MRALIRILNLILLVALITLSAPLGAFAKNTTPRYNWLQFNGFPQHSGNNPSETFLTPGNVSQLARLFQVTLPAVADSAPATLGSVSTAQGLKFLLYLTTTDGHILALDAQTGATIWSHQYGPNGCIINNNTASNSPCYTTSSPAVDPDLQYIYSYGLDGYVHKYQAGTGVETTTPPWPELVTLKRYDEKGSSALSIATASSGVSYLYVSNGGYPGDNGDYQGHITAINLSDGTQKVFNTVCSNLTVHFDSVASGNTDCPELQTAIWSRPGVVYDPATDRIYMATGNGTYDPASHDWGDTMFALNPDGSGGPGGDPLDTYTPTNYAALQAGDVDLGSTAPALLPALPGSNSKNQHVAVQSGKDAKLRLINLDDMSGQGGPGHTGGEISVINVPQGGEVLTTPAVWANPANGTPWVFITNGNGVSGLPIVLNGSGNDTFGTSWQVAGGATSPIVVNGMLFVTGGGLIRALNPLNGHQLWSDNGIGSIHWESPVVANGVLYITDDDSHLTAYSLGGANPGLVSTIYNPIVIK